MEDSYYAPQEIRSQERRPNFFKRNLMLICMILAVFSLVTVAFYIGRQSQKLELPTNTEVAQDNPAQPTQIIKSLTPTPKVSVTPSKKPNPKNSPTPIFLSKVLIGSPDLDGFRSSNGEGNQYLEVRVGRNINLVTRGFVTFPLDDLPSGVFVKEAYLRLYQVKVVGKPYVQGGAIKVDHLSYGDGLDATDYGMPALVTNTAVLSTTPATGWKETDVTQSVKDDIENGRSRSQFRLHLTVENTGGDSNGDFALFESSENYLGTGYIPELLVKYY